MSTKMVHPCHGSMKYEGDLLEKELIEFYELAREATREALKECNAKLASSLQLSPAWVHSSTSHNSIQISPLSLKFDGVEVDKEYCPVLRNQKDFIPFGAEFIIQMLLLYCLLFLRQAKDQVIQEDSLLCLHHPCLSSRLISNLWILIIYVLMIIIHFRHRSWYNRYRNMVLFVAYASMFLVEGLTILSFHLEASSLNFCLILGRPIISSVLHQVPFWVVGCVLQIIGILVVGVNDDTWRIILYLSMGHGLSMVLAYLVDQQPPRIGFLRYIPRTKRNGTFGGSIYCQGIPRRALGGFAGGFAGVSSLKCASAPPLWTTTCM